MNALNQAADHRRGPLKKSDLKFAYAPSAIPGDDPTKRGLPDSTFLNRQEWYEVLWFVNMFSNTYGQGEWKGSTTVALKAERLIKLHLPGTVRSHQNVAQWLLNNWNNYQ